MLVGFLVYFTVPFVLASGASMEQLPEQPDGVDGDRPGAARDGAMGRHSLESAIGSILAAPRTLQALADDNLVPAAFGRVDPVKGEPMFALWVSGAVALVAVALGDLNAVASVVTMFFLTTYGMLNLASALESLVADPAFRPKIKVPWWVSLIGCAGCFVAMFSIHPVACFVAIVVEGCDFVGPEPPSPAHHLG